MFIEKGYGYMKKTSYLDRKLTDNEQIMATQYHYIIFYYMKLHQLNFSEWYDVLAIPYIQSIKKYCEFDHLQQYSITTIIFQTLDSAVSNQFRKQKRHQQHCISYDKVEDYLLYVKPVSVPISFEKKVFSNIMLFEILNHLSSNRQKIIVRMLSRGYTKVDIKNFLLISDYCLRKEINIIRELMCSIYFN